MSFSFLLRCTKPIFFMISSQFNNDLIMVIMMMIVRVDAIPWHGRSGGDAKGEGRIQVTITIAITIATLTP